MANVDALAVPVRRAGVREELIEGELLLYVPDATKAIYLNATAAVIWGLCDGKRSLNELISILAETYPEAGADLSGQVQDALAQLVQLDVIALA